MGILAWIVVGLVAGWLIGIIVRGSGYHMLVNIIVGIVGALIGGWIAGVLLDVPIDQPNLSTILLALLGSLVLIGLLRVLGRSEIA